MTTARSTTLRALSGLVFCLAVLLPATGATQSGGEEATGSGDHWTGGTAKTLEAGRFERGIFLPLRWGVHDRVELSAFPLAEAGIPNLKAKIRLSSEAGTTVSTNVALAYPTPILNMLAKSGTGGILPVTSEIPPMLSLHLGVSMTRELGRGHELTTSMKLTTTPRFTGDADFPTIDLPVIYPRTASYHTAATGRGGLDVRGPLSFLSERFGYRASVDAFFLPGTPSSGGAAIEHSGRFAWAPGPKLRLMAGYFLSWGHYPFGRQWNAYPLFDLQFAW